MSNALHTFLQSTLGSHTAVWESSAIQAVSHLAVPERVYGGREELLRGDIYFVWARWFLESICDPARFLEDSEVRYGPIFGGVFGNLQAILAGTPRDEVRAVAAKLALLVAAEVGRRQARKREATSLDERRRLIDESVGPPRCWVCGYRFTEAALKRFLKEDEGASILRPLRFVDCMTLRGQQLRDLLIEVDHVLPVAEGGVGSENLRLACGWCNRHKSDNLSLYEQAFSPIRIRHPSLGLITIPRPFWVVRLLSYRRRCEWSDGCDQTTANAELFIAARWLGGAMNPANIQVVCERHDPLGSNRLVSPERVEVLS